MFLDLRNVCRQSPVVAAYKLLIILKLLLAEFQGFCRKQFFYRVGDGFQGVVKWILGIRETTRNNPMSQLWLFQTEYLHAFSNRSYRVIPTDLFDFNEDIFPVGCNLKCLQFIPNIAYSIE